ncbi:glucose-6-phosphate isomerase [Candidatus Pelagibacter sp.]|nr:glucose-6-phosphate isomerase [Candidatus Pelagibacter sp.]
MLSSRIKFKKFKNKNSLSKISKIYKNLVISNTELLRSLSKNYNQSFTEKTILKHKKNKNFRIIGMGGSTLGSQAIYDFLNHKIKKNFEFIDNLIPQRKNEKKKFTNLIVSKSGNTIETIVNTNILIKKREKNIFITEDKNSYLNLLAKKLKAEIINHNNFIGGRYSVLSEVGMLPAELMGLDSNKFKQLNSLIKNKKFENALLSNVAASLYYLKKKKFNSIIINYDEKSENLFKWYQQLVAESLGKKNLGILPMVSIMPRDNHSVMQLYLDGFKNNFFTFFYVKQKKSDQIINKNILSLKNYLKNKDVSEILYAQKNATENVFKKKNIPFRSFEIYNRDEKTLGELFCFFILETILIGKALKIDPYNQPAVELIKKETKKLLVN